MRNQNNKSVWIFIVIGVGIAAIMIYQLPAVKQRLSWRIDFALAYLRGVVDPIEAVPTAQPKVQAQITQATTNTPTATATNTATPVPSPTVVLTPTFTPTPTPLPDMISLTAPGYEKQDINNCGPASLAMYMRYYGWEGDQHQIADLLKPFRDDRNVNVEELAYYVRTRAGWLNIEYRVGGDLTMIKEFLAAGIPVMTEESFYFEEPYWPNDDLWAAHYQLLTGYDENTQRFTGQDSFYGPDRSIPYEKMDEYWQAFNRVYILVYLPHQAETVENILGAHVDPGYNRQHALEIAQKETAEDPDNAFAWFNLGANLAYFERYVEATEAFDRAREIGLPQRMFRYQFSPFMAYFHSGQITELVALTEYALKITPNAEEAWLWHGWAMYRNGDTRQAIADFERALVENPNYQDAIYALDFARANP